MFNLKSIKARAINKIKQKIVEIGLDTYSFFSKEDLNNLRDERLLRIRDKYKEIIEWFFDVYIKDFVNERNLTSDISKMSDGYIKDRNEFLKKYGFMFNVWKKDALKQIIDVVFFIIDNDLAYKKLFFNLVYATELNLKQDELKFLNPSIREKFK